MHYVKNIGLLDAILRIGAGLGLIFLGFASDLINDNVASILLGIIGIIMFTSGVFRYCPMYTLIGFSSCNPK